MLNKKKVQITIAFKNYIKLLYDDPDTKEEYKIGPLGSIYSDIIEVMTRNDVPKISVDELIHTLKSHYEPLFYHLYKPFYEFLIRIQNTTNDDLKDQYGGVSKNGILYNTKVLHKEPQEAFSFQYEYYKHSKQLNYARISLRNGPTNDKHRGFVDFPDYFFNIDEGIPREVDINYQSELQENVEKFHKMYKDNNLEIKNFKFVDMIDVLVDLDMVEKLTDIELIKLGHNKILSDASSSIRNITLKMTTNKNLEKILSYDVSIDKLKTKIKPEFLDSLINNYETVIYPDVFVNTLEDELVKIEKVLGKIASDLHSENEPLSLEIKLSDRTIINSEGRKNPTIKELAMFYDSFTDNIVLKNDIGDIIDQRISDLHYIVSNELQMPKHKKRVKFKHFWILYTVKNRLHDILNDYITMINYTDCIVDLFKCLDIESKRK